ncbi:MAG: CO dehydrogenase/CO-methylating acetyl-CoA synthase complex subunit beta [Coriobacteriaceae bacterium]|nr:CO dehydrogenase/CO-methylating acetyl-CoA synthase complex subunit beta [Coriobacteriaceae bacterium]
MSKIIASAAIRGAHSIFERTEAKLARAKESFGADAAIELPNTGYYLPVIYGLIGEKVEKLSDMDKVLGYAKDLLPEVPTENLWLPYLGTTLDAGIATLLAEECHEALTYLDSDPPPVTELWLGAADDVIMRAKGVEFVDGSAPGFAAVVGAAPDNATAVRLAREMQEKMLYVFMAGHDGGVSFGEQLEAEGVQLGWDTRLVPFGKEVYSQIYSVGFATRAAMAFGGVQPGDYERILAYNKSRVFAFVLAMGTVTDEWYATAAGAISYGFPTIATSDIPQILPTGVCTYEHVVSNVTCDELVQRAIEVRGLKIKVLDVPVPVSYGPAFEGERVRKEDTYAETGGQKSPAFEWVRTLDAAEVTDGKIEVVGPELDEIEEGSAFPIGIVVDVAGRKMQSDFEPVVERQVHHMLNFAEGVLHMGQRDLIWIRISKVAKDKGFKLHHLGDILHAKFLDDFEAIVDKVQVTIYTEPAKVEEMRELARVSYAVRDERMAGLTDDTVEVFYSCTLCQSFAPSHICVVTPERLGLCGAYNWLDAKTSNELNPAGPNQPIDKGTCLDTKTGEWAGVNQFIAEKSGGAVERMTCYSLMDNPMTSCGCFMAIIALMPMCNGVMIVNREYAGMTPSGMKFSTLAGTIGGGVQVPGFMGIGRGYIASKKFMSAEGGLGRVVWMPKELKESMRSSLGPRMEEMGDPGFLDRIADETVGETEEAVLEFIAANGHPAPAMDPMF